MGAGTEQAGVALSPSMHPLFPPAWLKVGFPPCGSLVVLRGCHPVFPKSSCKWEGHSHGAVKLGALLILWVVVLEENGTAMLCGLERQTTELVVFYKQICFALPLCVFNLDKPVISEEMVEKTQVLRMGMFADIS